MTAEGETETKESGAANPADPKASGSTNRRLTEAEWAEMRELYELGKAQLVDLADQYGVSRQAIHARFKAHGVVKGSRAGEVASAVNKAATGAPSAAGAAVLDRFTDKKGEWIEETRLTGFNNLKLVRSLATKIVRDKLSASHPISAADDEFKALGRLNKILCDNIAATLSLLEADKFIDKDELPSLNIEDFTDADILKHHISTGALPEGTTVEEMLSGESEVSG